MHRNIKDYKVFSRCRNTGHKFFISSENRKQEKLYTFKILSSTKFICVDSLTVCFEQHFRQDGVKVQQATIAPVTVAVGGIANAAIGAVSPDQITQVQLQQAQQASDQEVQPGKRLRRVACSCPNCREGEGR